MLPPGILVLAALAGLIVLQYRRNTGVALIAASLLALYALSTPAIAYYLIGTLQSRAPPITEERWTEHRPDAIVVLGGGRYTDPPEYEGDVVGAATLVRVRYAAFLHRRFGTPILVTGGPADLDSVPEADLMQAALEGPFAVPVRWTEPASGTTWENALESDGLLAREGIVRVAIVTQAWHMPRALWSFRAVGMAPLAAPTGFEKPDPRDHGAASLLPRHSAFQLSALALREHLGLLWYRMRMGGWRPEAVDAP